MTDRKINGSTATCLVLLMHIDVSISTTHLEGGVLKLDRTLGTVSH